MDKWTIGLTKRFKIRFQFLLNCIKNMGSNPPSFGVGFLNFFSKFFSYFLILAFYPTDYDQQQINMVKKYCFPFDDKRGTHGMPHKETFTFIITRENGKYNFGYCLIENDFSTNSSIVYCILRYKFMNFFCELFFFKIFYQCTALAKIIL